MPKYRRKPKRPQAPYDNQKNKGKPPEENEDTEESFTCAKCSKSVEQVLQCEYCLKWYCCACENVPNGMMTALIEYKSIHWFCSECEPTTLAKLSIYNSKPSEVANQSGVANGCETVDTIINGITEPLKMMMEKMVKSIIESFESLRGSLQYAQVGISMDTDVTTKDVRPPAVKDTNTRVIDEYMDRERRKCNVIVHNMAEETPSQDHDRVGSLFESEFDIPKSSITSMVRLGRSSGDRARLLQVTLDKEQHKHSIMKMATKLRKSQRWNTIYVTPDLTFKEREVNKALRDELKRRKANGEQNLIIKRGRIISKGGNSQPVPSN